MTYHSKGLTLKALLENPDLLEAPKFDNGSKKGHVYTVNAQFGFLGPNIWDRTITNDDESGEFDIEYMELDEFLCENGIPMNEELFQDGMIQKIIDGQSVRKEDNNKSNHGNTTRPSRQNIRPSQCSRQNVGTSTTKEIILIQSLNMLNSQTVLPKDLGNAQTNRRSPMGVVRHKSRTVCASSMGRMIAPRPPGLVRSPQTSVPVPCTPVPVPLSPIPVPLSPVPQISSQSATLPFNINTDTHDTQDVIVTNVLDSDTDSESCSGNDLMQTQLPGLTDFDPRQAQFSEEDLRPQPMIKKAHKIFVPDDMKDVRYWCRRKKNNVAAKRSRDARRVKENQIAMRAAFLESELTKLRQQLDEALQSNSQLEKRLSKYENL